MLRSCYRRVTKTYRYDSIDKSFDGFFIDVVEIDLMTYEVWLYHKDYGVKDLMFSVYCNAVKYPALIDMIGANIVDSIHSYIDEYFD